MLNFSSTPFCCRSDLVEVACVCLWEKMTVVRDSKLNSGGSLTGVGAWFLKRRLFSDCTHLVSKRTWISKQWTNCCGLGGFTYRTPPRFEANYLVQGRGGANYAIHIISHTTDFYDTMPHTFGFQLSPPPKRVGRGGGHVGWFQKAAKYAIRFIPHYIAQYSPLFLSGRTAFFFQPLVASEIDPNGVIFSSSR